MKASEVSSTQHAEGEDSVGRILVMTYGNVPIIRRDLKEIISRSQKVCYINLN
jgi:hypothetical protein